MTGVRRSRLFARVEQHVHAEFHGPVDVNGGVVGIVNAGRERRPRSVRAAARVLFGPQDPPVPDRPSAWLDPRAGVLPAAPRAELADLLAWCRDPQAPTARLVTGAGGQGKTHLALSLCSALGRGWLTGFVRRGGGELRAATAALGRFRVTGALLVVDYAEDQQRLVHDLLEAAGPRVRVLVIARGTPHWWRDLVDGGPRRWADPDPLRLDTLASSEALWTQAVRVFAERLGRPPDLSDPPRSFATTLDLYASALLRALGDDDQHDPMAGVLRHERAAFHAAARRAGLSDGGWRDLALSAAVLRPADTVSAGAEVLAAVPALRALDPAKLRAAASALAAAYPGDGRTLWRAPTPDRLADTHLLATAEAQPTDAEWDEHVHAVCATDDPAVADHVTRVLTRALTTPGAHDRHATGLRRLIGSITALVRACPAYVPPLARVDPVRFRDLIVEQVALIPAATVAHVEADLAGPTTSRLAIAVAVARRLAHDDPRHLATLSARLAEAGDTDAALDAAQRAVELVTDPLDRASAHTALCHRLAEQDRPSAALAAARIAADLRRTASTAVRGHAQHNLALRLAEAGHADEAVIAATEAVDLLLSAGGHERPRLAAALIGLAQVLDAAGFPARAAAPATEAVRLLRELAADDPDAYLPALAAALLVLSRTGAPDPVTTADEAVTIYTGLSTVNSAAYGPALAAARMNLGLRLAAAGNRADADTELRRAVDASPADPTALAAALLNLTLHRAESGDIDLPTAERVVALHRSRPEPGADLPAALADLGYLRAAAGRHAEARDATAEAVAGYRTLLAAEPSALRRVWLADALLDSARHALRLSTKDALLDTVLEAVDLYADVEGELPDTAQDRFRTATSLLAALDSDDDIPAQAHAYCRRWREALVRVPLPGVATLAVLWRTDTEPRSDRVRPVGEDAIALAQPQAATGQAAAQPALARLVAGSVAKVRDVAERVAQRPEVQPVLQYVQQNPVALARAAAALTAVALLISAASPGSSGSAQAAPPPVVIPPSTSSGPTTTTAPSPSESRSPLTTPTTTTPTTGTPEPSGPRTSGPSTAEPPPPPPPTSTVTPSSPPPTTTPDPRPRPGDTVVDVAGTSYERFTVVGVSGGWRDARESQRFGLEPGDYELQFWGGGTVPFTVTPERTVDYPAASSAFLSGRGTQTLTARGLPVSATASDTSYAQFYVSGAGGWRSAGAAQQWRLLPGAHQLHLQGGPSIAFTVDGAGRFAHTGVHAPYLSGLGTSAIGVHGRTVTIDPRPTSYTGFLLLGTGEPWQSTRTARGYRLIPGPHTLATQDGAQTRFTVDREGLVDYAAPLATALGGRGTTGLVMHGVETTVDAAATDHDLVSVVGAGGWRPAVDPNTYRLLPGTHQVALNGGPTHTFTTDGQGRVDYAVALDGALAGRGSTTLTLRGPRVRWGFTRVEANGATADATGTWRQHPDRAVSTREPTVDHVATGRYRVRLPELSSGITHVGSADPGKTGVTCTVSDSGPDGRDLVAEVRCHHPRTGALTDNRFTILHTGLRPGVAAIDTRTGLRVGPISTRETGPGTHEVVIAGRSTTGDLQITPNGDSAARCQARVTERTDHDMRIEVQCDAVTGGPSDTTWALSYADGAPLVPSTGAYVVTTGPGLRVDPKRSHNSAGGAMKAVWLEPGNYRVGLTGVGAIPDTAFVAIDDPRPGHCTAQQWISTDSSGELWVYATCFDAAGNRAERNFRVSTVRAPGQSRQDVRPLDPWPHPPGPKWGYYRVSGRTPIADATWPILPERGWTTWLRHLTYRQTHWAPDPTVSHPERGRFLIRLPGMATTALPHVQPVGDETADCVVAGAAPAGPDLTVDVRCTTTRAVLPDVMVTVAEPRPDDGPTLVVGPGVQTASTGARVDFTRTSEGEYTVDVTDPAFDGTGHPLLTALSTEQTRCGIRSVTAGMTLRVQCTRAGRPADSLWHLTYIQGTGPSAPTTTIHTDGQAITTHHDTFGRAPTLTEINLGDYLLHAPSAANPRTYPLYATLVTATQPGTRCVPLGWNASTPHAHIRCVDASGRHTRTSFSAIYLRLPGA